MPGKDPATEQPLNTESRTIFGQIFKNPLPSLVCQGDDMTLTFGNVANVTNYAMFYYTICGIFYLFR